MQADRSKVRLWSVSSDPVGGFKSLQGRGRKLPHASLRQEGALDGLQLRSGLGVLQGRVGGCHGTLGRSAKNHIFVRRFAILFEPDPLDKRRHLNQFGVVVRELAVGQFVSVDDPGMPEDLPSRQSLVGVHVEHL